MQCLQYVYDSLLFLQKHRVCEGIKANLRSKREPPTPVLKLLNSWIRPWYINFVLGNFKAN